MPGLADAPDGLFRDTVKEEAMSRLDTIDFNELIEKATKERCEITIVYEPDRTEVTIQPWKPFQYSCPYANTTQEEAQP